VLLFIYTKNPNSGLNRISVLIQHLSSIILPLLTVNKYSSSDLMEYAVQMTYELTMVDIIGFICL
jgi:hypothetical protein